MLGNPLLLGDDGYNISRSVRLRSSASAYFNRTPASTGNQQKFTLSMWAKLGSLTANCHLFNAYGSSTNRFEIYYQGASSPTSVIGVDMNNGSWVLDLATAQVFRDPSAWYHLVFAVDTTQATNTNRVKLWVNNVQASFTQSSGGGAAVWFAQNTNTPVNTAVSHLIGMQGASAGAYLDGYLTEINFIDGQALDSSYFGTTDPVTGVWKAKKYTGTYGTNGFYLNFSDPSAATAAAIGKDSSGNGNNWTPNNISVTAGATYDSMIDVPTMYADGGNGRGNYCVANPLKRYTANFAISNGNLTLTDSTAAVVSGACSMSTGTSGKYYFECTMTAVAVNTAGAGSNFVGVAPQTNIDASIVSAVGAYRSGNPIYNLASVAQTAGSTYTTGDVIGVAVDVTNGTVQFYKNNVAQGATPSFTFTAGTELFPYCSADNVAGTKTFDFNFGQRPFTYTPPTGFLALNTQNLPDATIKAGNKYFDVSLYTGNHSTNAIVNSGGFQPDFVWIKDRSAVAAHVLFDSVRGVGGFLNTNNTTAEDTTLNYAKLNSFNSNGFTLGASTLANDLSNYSGDSFVGWQWKKGAAQGFDIVTYTGNGSGAVRTIAHSLGVAPKLMINKARSTSSTGTDHWVVYHGSFSAGDYILLSATNAKANSSSYWGNTVPTSSSFYVGSPANNVSNESGIGYVTYLFAEVAGFSKFGSYTGNGSTDGPFVYCGFRPRFVMVKSSSGVENWMVYDSVRDTYNVETQYLIPNSSGAEGALSPSIDLTSNGFKVRYNGSPLNTSSGTYIFAAFAENPFKNSLAR
jgi:hypothetical protein